ncbi:MAG: tungstate transport system permease protein [Methanosaeta sp. NSM2]|nr:ABC transporter permease [Methanothrix sp.]OYV13538.1 MAG: tungstate transport system permease protein [Methanosaeta sp. NSM2]
MEEIWNGVLRAIELIATLNPEVLEITARSLSISFSAVFVAAAIGIPLGALIELREFRGKKALVNLIQTLYGLPTVTVGLLVFLILSRSGPLGNLELLYTPTGMVIGQMILVSPILIGLTISALKGVSPQIRDTAVSLGADESQLIRAIIKEARFAVIAAVLIGFGRALSEVGVAMMIGGNIRDYTRVLTTSIALQTSMGNLEMSMALGIILIGISMILNLSLSRFQGR